MRDLVLEFVIPDSPLRARKIRCQRIDIDPGLKDMRADRRESLSVDIVKGKPPLIGGDAFEELQDFLCLFAAQVEDFLLHFQSPDVVGGGADPGRTVNGALVPVSLRPVVGTPAEPSDSLPSRIPAVRTTIALPR